MPLFSQTYHELRREGLPFRKQYDETKVPVLTPPPSAPSQHGGLGSGRGSAFGFEPEAGEGTGTSSGGEGGDNLLKMADTSDTMLKDILYAAGSPQELEQNEILPDVLAQCKRLAKALQEAIEAKVVEGAEDLEDFFKVR